MERKIRTTFRPVKNEDEIIEMYRGLVCEIRADREFLKNGWGISRSTADLIRGVFGKSKTQIQRAIPKELKEKARNLYKKGLKLEEIEKETGIKKCCLFSFIEAERQIPWTEIKKRELVYLREKKKMSWKDIAMKTGRSVAACFMKYKKLKNTGW